MPASPSRTTLSRRQLLVAAGVIAAGILAGGSVIDTYRFRIVRLAVRAAGLRESLRVAFLTDLHFGTWIHRASVSAWVDAAVKESPDLVVLGGDIVDQTAGADVTPLLDELARLRAPLGTYAVWGNHDHRRFPETDVFARELADAGVDVLVNRGVGLRNDLYLAGIDDLRLGQPDLHAALADWPPGRACLLASHNPDVLPDVPETVALTLCGHTHGGQVCIPLFGPIVTNSRYGKRFAQGPVQAPALGYVSRGLGVSAVPLRVACPAELTVIDLDPLASDPTAPAVASALG